MTEERQYANFFKRIAAFIIDFLLFVLPSLAINIVTLKIIGIFVADSSGLTLSNYLVGRAPTEVMNIVPLVAQLAWCFIAAAFLSKKWQATPGKRLMSVYVINQDGSKPSYKTGFVRSLLPVLFVSVVNFISLFFTSKNTAEVSLKQLIVPIIFTGLMALWYLAAAFTKERTAVHDMIVGTRVLKGRV